MRWYLRYGLSYRDVEELLAERGIEFDHVTIYRWVQRFTAEVIDLTRSAGHATGNRWFIDESYVKVAGRWTYLYRAFDQYGQLIDVGVCAHRDRPAGRALFARALTGGSAPVEVITDRAPFYPGVVDALVRTARQVTERYESNRIEADHGRLRRGCVRCGVKTIKSLQVVATGYAFVQDLRRGHYERTVDLPLHDRVRPAFAQLADCL